MAQMLLVQIKLIGTALLGKTGGLFLFIPETFGPFECIYLSVIAFVSKPLFFQPPKKVMQRFFLGCTGPYYGPTNTNHTKNYQKTTFGALFRPPPQIALQCTTVQCNVL